MDERELGTSSCRDTRRSSALDINWPFNDQQTADLLTRATGTGTIDETALPTALADKRRRLGHHHTPYPPFDWRHPFTHPGWHYTPTERRALRSATVSWPSTRDDLAPYANRDILEAEWDTRFADTPPPTAGAAALVWREPNVVATAYNAANSALHSRLWKTKILDDHHARIDIDAIMIGITTGAHRLWRTHADTHLHIGATDNTTWTTLLATIDALIDYQRALNGRAALLIAYSDILRTPDIDDSAICLEFGLPLNSPEPLDRTAIVAELRDELTALITTLAATTAATLNGHAR